MFNTVLVANRGEIAVRIIDTLRRTGIRSVAIYSDADADARHVHEAHVAVRIGPADATRSYLSIPDIVAAAVRMGAQAVHPGYGFLAENTEFAVACEKAGLVFIGPGAEAIDAMGDKIRAKHTVSEAGVPVVPGVSDVDFSAAGLSDAAARVGYPLLLKPSAGGGGKGMRIVDSADDLEPAAASARREANAAFGDDTLLIERFVRTPRHIEVQVLADSYGHVIHLGERECSLQRRHQKIIEEAPSVLLDEETRSWMGRCAVEAARAVGYVGAGTVEFIVSSDAADEFFFMEMNTRLQVEHPVTELVTGIDLVAWQLKIAAGQRLALAQQEIHIEGHAVEARVYAEAPERDFAPTGGTVLAIREPDGEGVRIDSWLRPGTVIGGEYDPMLAKVITWGSDRPAALQRLDLALSDTAVLGVHTNVPFLRALLGDERVRAGNLDTELVDRQLSSLISDAVPDEFLIAGVLDRLLTRWPTGGVVDPWQLPSGWRLSAAGGIAFRLRSGEREAMVRVTGPPHDAIVTIDDADPEPASASRRDPQWLELRCRGEFRRYLRAADVDGTLWLAGHGHAVAIGEHAHLLATHGESAESGPITSPMPGTVLLVKVAAGEQVSAGTALLVVEAMKMEHTITAPTGGVVSELHVQPGQQVALGEALAVVTGQEHEE